MLENVAKNIKTTKTYNKNNRFRNCNDGSLSWLPLQQREENYFSARHHALQNLQVFTYLNVKVFENVWHKGLLYKLKKILP